MPGRRLVITVTCHRSPGRGSVHAIDALTLHSWRRRPSHRGLGSVGSSRAGWRLRSVGLGSARPCHAGRGSRTLGLGDVRPRRSG
jgi:hypothetical protein